MTLLKTILCVLLAAAPTTVKQGTVAAPQRAAIRLYADQIGYRSSARKILIVASDAPIPRGLEIQITPAAGGPQAWKLSGHPDAGYDFNHGERDSESGDYVRQVDFTQLSLPGRYRASAPASGAQSYAFNVGPNPYYHEGLAVFKAFYYQRADTAKPAQFAGAWSHGANHLGPNQSRAARRYKWAGGQHWDPIGKEIADPAPHDVTGGWWDAGDFNKYTSNTMIAHNELLLAVQLIGSGAHDRDLNIPESGNRVPDELDETRWGTDYFLRLADSEGAAWGRVHELGTSPPEADQSPVQLTETTSSATMSRCAALAYAALVWNESGLDAAYAASCRREAERSWALLAHKPHPWPADPKDPAKQAYTGDWFNADFSAARALAAACLFRLSGDRAYDSVVRTETAGWTAGPPGEKNEILPAIWVYCRAPHPDPLVAQHLKSIVRESAEAAVRQTGRSRAYSAGLRGYWWGSNRLAAAMGALCIVGARLSDSTADASRYLDAAEEFAHYLNGRNPIGLCFFSNLKPLGAEHSVMTMFHSWVGKDGDPNSARYIGEGPGKVGPFPGMLVGGVNGGMKKYVDVLDWRLNPWEFSEPDITYQSPAAILMGTLALRDR